MLLFYTLAGVLSLLAWACFKYWRAMPSPPMLLGGWLAGLTFFLVAPLSFLVLSGSYTVPRIFHDTAPWTSANLDDPSIVRPILLLAIGVAVCFLAALLGMRLQHRALAKPGSEHGKNRRVLGLSLAFSGLEWGLRIYTTGGLSALLLTPFDRRSDNASYLSVFWEHLSVANHLVFVAAAAAYFVSANKNWRWTALALAGLGMQLLMTGNRIFLATFLCIIAVESFRLFHWRRLLILLAMVPFLAIMANVWIIVRGNWNERSSSWNISWQQSDYRAHPLINRAMDATEGADLLTAIQVFRKFGVTEPLLHGDTYLHTMYLFIPRSIYPDKPDTFTVIIARILDPTLEGFSMPATAVAEMYANFGMAFLAGLALLTFFAASLRSTWSSHHGGRVDELLFFAIGFWLVRSAFSDTVALGVLAWGIMSAFTHFGMPHLPKLNSFASPNSIEPTLGLDIRK